MIYKLKREKKVFLRKKPLEIYSCINFSMAFLHDTRNNHVTNKAVFSSNNDKWPLRKDKFLLVVSFNLAHLSAARLCLRTQTILWESWGLYSAQNSGTKKKLRENFLLLQIQSFLTVWEKRIYIVSLAITWWVLNTFILIIKKIIENLNYYFLKLFTK